MFSYILCQPILQDFKPNNNMIFFTWHIVLTHALCLFCSFSLSAQWDHCALITFAKHLTSQRKRYRKTVQKKPHSPNRLNPYVCSPFHQTPAGKNSHPHSLVCFFWLLVPWEHLNSWILCKPIFIWPHYILIYGHFQAECTEECFLWW